MKLLKGPFLEIKARRKNVEMRLYDEKRQGIAVGDRVLFTCADFPGEKICAEVKALYIYDNFRSLAESFSSASLGFEGFSSKYISEYMLEIYGKEKEEKYGALAIELKFLK